MRVFFYLNKTMVNTSSKPVNSKKDEQSTTVLQHPQIDSIMLPQQNQPPILPPPSSALADGTYVVIIITGLFTLAKMALPALANLMKDRDNQRRTLEMENHRVDLEIEAATSASLRKMVETFTNANINQAEKVNTILVERITDTLSQVSEKLVVLGQQSEHIAETQRQIAQTQSQIAETQSRSMIILEKIEANLSSKHKPRLLIPGRSNKPNN